MHDVRAARDRVSPSEGKTAVLLDTNMLVSMVRDDPRELAARDQVKLATLTCDQFYVTGATLAEFEALLRRSRAAEDPRFMNALRDLQRLFSRDHFSVIDVRSLVDGQTDNLRATLRELETIAAPFTHHRHQLLLHDALLIVVSDATGVPILTMDRKIHRLAPKRIFEVAAPLPFDLEALRAVPFADAFDLSAPLRSVYRQAIDRFRAKARALAEVESTAKRLDRDLSLFRDVAQGQEAEMGRLRAQLLDVMRSERFWREAARPDCRATLAWTLAELAVSLLPFPIPTTPLAHFVEARRHSARERKQPPQRQSVGQPSPCTRTADAAGEECSRWAAQGSAQKHREDA